jgi:long-chain-fatty-acid--CoA ligase ACSBG
LSYLPLSHIAAQLLDVHAPLAITANGAGSCCTVSFARPDALRGSLGTSLKAVRPTAFLGVPRVWEKIQEKLRAIAATVKGPTKVLSTWAKATAAAKVAGEELIDEADVDTNAPGSSFGFPIAKAVVLSKVHGALGLDRCKLFGTAAAPMATTTWRYFASLYIRLMDLYGMSECSGPQTCALPSAYRAGFCGRSLPGCELKLLHVPGRDPTDEGEVCYRGRHVMMGYLDDEAQTRAALDADGWLHSGDVGRLEGAAQMLKITGRVKELLITAGGENVAPVPIEDALRSLLPHCSNVMLVGDRQKYLSVLVTLHLEPDGDGYSGALAGPSAQRTPHLKTAAEARVADEWRDYVQAGIEAYNSSPTMCVSRAQKIATFAILDTDFSIAGGELTPTHKLKRAFTAAKFRAVIDGELYAGAALAKNAQSAFNLSAAT